MSRLVYPPQLSQAHLGPVETLHCVLPNTDKCCACGASKFAMRFRYTDNVEYFEEMRALSADLYVTGGAMDAEGRLGMYRTCDAAPTPVNPNLAKMN